MNKKGKTLEGLKPKDFQELQIFLRFPAISMVKPNLTHKVNIALLIRGRRAEVASVQGTSGKHVPHKEVLHFTITFQSRCRGL